MVGLGLALEELLIKRNRNEPGAPKLWFRAEWGRGQALRELVLAPDGGNLTNVLRTLNAVGDPRHRSILEDLHSLLRHVEGSHDSGRAWTGDTAHAGTGLQRSA